MSKGGSMHQKHPPAKVATSRPASGGGRASCAAAGSPDTVAPSPSGSVSRRAPRRGARRDVFAPRAPFAPDPDDALAWVTVTEALDLPVQAPALLPLIPLVVSIGAIGKKKITIHVSRWTLTAGRNARDGSMTLSIVMCAG